MSKKTKSGVFIIESLDFKDEKDDSYEGKILSRILSLSNVPTEYFYIRTMRELKKIIRIFSNSNLRYLHISCHGSASALYTTLDKISFKEVASILNPHIDNKRLFLSACSSVNENLADQILL